MKPGLRVIEGRGLQHPLELPRAHATCSSEPLILPPVKIRDDLAFSLMGITSRQANMAFYAVRCGGDEQLGMAHAIGRVLNIQDQLAAALTVLRGEYLSALMKRYPAAARRIMAGKPPRSRRKTVTVQSEITKPDDNAGKPS
jgi:hypothetical protein